MKSLPFFGLLLLGITRPGWAQTPTDTTGGRYYQSVFPAVTVTPNVTSGSAADFLGRPNTLVMNVYQPSGDATA